MKFIVHNLSKCAPRIGILSEIQRLPEVQLETPAAFLYTKGGSIPNLTREVFKYLTSEPQCLQVPICSTSNFHESLSGSNVSLAEFVGLKECLVYVTIQDPGANRPAGHHLQNNVPIWTRGGKTYLNPDSYMDMIELFKPDLYCVLSDGDTCKSSSKKRVSKSVDQTLCFFDKCLERQQVSETLKHSMVIASVEGGHCLKSRERCLNGLLEKEEQFGGVLVNGLHNNGPDLEVLSFDEVKPIVEYIFNNAPSNKLRIIEGCWNPVNVINFIKLGADIFDTSYVNLLTDRASALIFDFVNSAQNTYEINLKHDAFSDDFSPLKQGCTCLTCTKYTRAYIHHLFTVQELLGPILLTIHNIHHYLEFFKTIRCHLKNGTLDILQNNIQTQFEHFQLQTESSKQIVEKIE